MTQCAGKTQKGDRCRRDAREGSPFCGLHQDQGRPRAERSQEWDTDAMLKAAIGFGLIAAIVLLRIRR